MELDKAKKIERQLEVCYDELEKLTTWERGFIESVSDQFTLTGFLSIKQQDILQKIYDKAV